MSGAPCPKVIRPPKVQRGLQRTQMKRKTKKRDNEFTNKVKAEADARSGGTCELHGPSCHRTDIVYHHVQRRGQNGSGTLENCLRLCDPGHKMLHAETRWARFHGFIRSEGWLPEECPMILCPLSCQIDHRRRQTLVSGGTMSSI